jgi:putative CocE/NonD family hydrolase
MSSQSARIRLMRFNGWSIGLINTLKALAATSRARRSPVDRVPALFLMLALVWPLFAAAAPPIPSEPDASNVSFRWNVKIPMRDGIKLSATVYTPREPAAPAPCIFTLTPYIAQSYHDRGVYFAAHGYPFLTVDVRGRGNSEGVFHPLIQEAQDGYDIVEWLAGQPYCNGKVTMWGGSYAGYDQWATAKEFPPHLATIVPVASPYLGVDFPADNEVFSPYDVQWLTFTSGHTSQDQLFADEAFWSAQFRRWYESGAAFKGIDALFGNPSTVFQEWIAHPHPDAFWDRYNPTSAQYAKLSIPILTITGSHDDDQRGALTHYREYMRNAAPEARARHYLVIGPWNHAGTRTPRLEFDGLTFGPASLVDLPMLHLNWYAWTMQGGAKPAFLQRNVAYYVMFADKWRYADTLEGVTRETRALLLDSVAGATDVFDAGSLSSAAQKGKPDHYVYDPHDVAGAALEQKVGITDVTDQRVLYAGRGKELIYHSAPFEQNTEISGFFKLSAWIAIDQPDTDFQARIYEVRQDGSSIPMTSQMLRARYRVSPREPRLVTTRAPLRYDFERFTFVSQEVKAGSRLRLVIAPINSIYSEKNYNSGGEVAAETLSDARRVTVTLYHDHDHPSTLFVPLGAAD